MDARCLSRSSHICDSVYGGSIQGCEFCRLSQQERSLVTIPGKLSRYTSLYFQALEPRIRAAAEEPTPPLYADVPPHKVRPPMQTLAISDKLCVGGMLWLGRP